MATKLPHERITEWVNESCKENHFPSFFMVMDLCEAGSTHDRNTERQAFNDLARKIERFYIPRSCDDNGEPWRMDDACTYFGKPYVVAGFDDTGFVCLWREDDDSYVWVPAAEVKRPSKMPDADGVPINTDDIVYRIGDSRRLKVADPHATLCGKPVVECVVLDDGRHSGDYPGADAVAYEASELTHKEPDSLEKLRDDVAHTLDQSEAVFPCGREGLEEIRDRLTALMERGA